TRYAKFKDRTIIFILLTLHKAENVDDPALLHILKRHLSELKYDVIFPVHPRTRKNLIKYDIQLSSNVTMIEPVAYLEFLGLLKKSVLILTDSGGVQEEALILSKPCITLRNSTERWETLLLRANRLFPLNDNGDNSSLGDVVGEMLDTKVIANNPYGENVTTNMITLLSRLMIVEPEV